MWRAEPSGVSARCKLTHSRAAWLLAPCRASPAHGATLCHALSFVDPHGLFACVAVNELAARGCLQLWKR